MGTRNLCMNINIKIRLKEINYDISFCSLQQYGKERRILSCYNKVLFEKILLQINSYFSFGKYSNMGLLLEIIQIVCCNKNLYCSLMFVEKELECLIGRLL